MYNEWTCFLIWGGVAILDFAVAMPHQAQPDALKDFQRSDAGTGDFTHRTALDEHDRYILLWKFDSETITFEAHVQTTGYIGLGFSPNGGMTGSDVIIGWVKDGQAFITDRIAEGYFQPRLDASQDVELLSGYETGTHTVLRFRRKLRPCDTVDDREITEDTQRVLWAFSDNDPVDLDGFLGPRYHGFNRGTKSIILLQKEEHNLDLQDSSILTVDFTNPNVVIPSKDTTYWCNAFRLPDLDRKHHMIRFEPIIQPGNEALLHHILIYQCKRGVTAPSLPEGHECYHPNMPGEWGDCYTIMAAWAVGGGAFTYPDHVGFSLGTNDDPDYILLETHYDNPNFLHGVRDSSGMRLYYTPNVRQYDAGILESGIVVTTSHIVPPQAESFDSAGFCFKECLTPYLQQLGQPIHVFASMLHAHLLGTGVRTKLVRDGRLETYLGRDENYDFDLQETRIIEPEIDIKEGDELITECRYRSTHMRTTTHGGLSSRDEMCQNYLQYYPRIKLDYCNSLTDINHLAQFFGVQSVDWSFPFQIYSPASMSGQTLYDVMNAHPWTSAEAERFDQHTRQGRVLGYCYGPAGSPSLSDANGQFYNPIPEPTVLAINSTAIPGC